MILMLLLLLNATPASNTNPPTITVETLDRGLRQIINEPAYRGASWGVSVLAPMRDGQKIFEYRSKSDLRPASTLKILTTLTAFEYLGPDYAFETQVLRSGPIEHGVVKGDLIVVAGGDPSFSGRYGGGLRTSDLLSQWVDRIEAAGVRRVEGNLLADLSFFDDQLIHPSWNRADTGGEYAVPVTPLSINDGLFEVVLEPDTRKKHNWVVWPLGQNDVQIIDQSSGLAKRGRRNVLSLYRSWGTNQFTARGNVIPCRSYSWTFGSWDPALNYMQALHHEMDRRGLVVSGRIGRYVPRESDQLAHVATWESDRLAELSKVLMKVSQNHYADCFLKTVGRVVNGEGSFASGAGVANEFLTRIATSSDQIGDQPFADGSGLSHQNRISAGQLTGLLNYGLAASYRDDWLATFPVTGVDGTLRSRGTGRTKGYVWAKTGFINRTRTLAGYVETLAGEPLIFAILVNDYRCSTGKIEVAQDRMCHLLRQLTPTLDVYEQREQRYYLSGLPLPTALATRHTLGGSR